MWLICGLYIIYISLCKAHIVYAYIAHRLAINIHGNTELVHSERVKCHYEAFTWAKSKQKN